MLWKRLKNHLEDVTAYRFVYGSDGDDDGVDENKMTTDVTHKYDGGSSRASLNATSGLLAVTKLLPLEKVKSIVWNHFGFPA